MRPSDVIEDAGKKMKALMRADLSVALKERRADEAKVVRTLIAAIDNAEAPPLPAGHAASVALRFESGAAEVERLCLSRSHLRRLLRTEIEEREQAAAALDHLNRADRAIALRAEALVVRRYLD